MPAQSLTVSRVVRWATHPRTAYANQMIYSLCDKTVQSGPFKGMKLNSSRESKYYLLGTYEKELHAALAVLLQQNWSRIINIGAGDGYYAVGIARANTTARVYAFEALDERRSALRAAAERNGVVDRIEIGGLCTTEDLRRVLADGKGGPTLVVVDIEGGERELIDPATLPELRNVWIFAETHDLFGTDCTKLLGERFKQSHDITQFKTSPRRLEDFPLSSPWLPRRLLAAPLIASMEEGRAGAQDWLLMKPNLVA